MRSPESLIIHQSLRAETVKDSHLNMSALSLTIWEAQACSVSRQPSLLSKTNMPAFSRLHLPTTSLS